MSKNLFIPFGTLWHPFGTTPYCFSKSKKREEEEEKSRTPLIFISPPPPHQPPNFQSVKIELSVSFFSLPKIQPVLSILLS